MITVQVSLILRRSSVQILLLLVLEHMFQQNIRLIRLRFVFGITFGLHLLG